MTSPGARVTNRKLGRLELTISAEEHQIQLRLVGYLDGSADLRELVGQVRGRVLIDVEGVSFVNSLGIRSWTRLLRQLRSDGVSVTLQRCSEAMVMQLNMIRDARAPVESFLCPYACGSCGRRAPSCIEVEPNRAGLARGEAPAVPCPDCKAPMVLDEMPERYLIFLHEPAR